MSGLQNPGADHHEIALELTYEFEYKEFGIGPVIGLGLSEDDNHYMFGIHIGKGF